MGIKCLVHHIGTIDYMGMNNVLIELWDEQENNKQTCHNMHEIQKECSTEIVETTPVEVKKMLKIQMLYL